MNLLDSGPQSKAEDRGRRAEGGGPGTRPSPVIRRPTSEIPEPSEPAQKFESEREMLDLIAPRAESAWPPSRKVVGAAPTKSGRGSVTASVMPEDLRVETGQGRGDREREEPGSGALPGPVSQGHLDLARRLQGQDTLATVKGSQGMPPQSVVLTPIEFGDTTPREPPRTETKPKERTEWVFRDGKYIQVIVTDDGSRLPKAPGNATLPSGIEKRANREIGGPGQPALGPAGPGQGSDWTLRNGQWVRTQDGKLPTAKPATAAPPAGPAVGAGPRACPELGNHGGVPLQPEWEQAGGTRLIRIPADKLLAGDPRYNIIIKPGDTIHVPVDIIGEFGIEGNVNRTGYVDLTGRPMTLKMAIAAAGGLGPLACPKNVEVVRRIGTAREEIVMVNLDKIASGEQPDFFIKPNDLINVGTEPLARFRAVLRNAFRATYGFGFVYDRNFADVDYYTGITHWF